MMEAVKQLVFNFYQLAKSKNQNSADKFNRSYSSYPLNTSAKLDTLPLS